MAVISWRGVGSVPSKRYVCGHCGSDIASDVGFTGLQTVQIANVAYSKSNTIYICHYCERPTFFNYDGRDQTPGPVYGKKVEHVSADVGGLYKESRLCYSAGAYTGSVLCSRKLLMNIAVSKTAKAGEAFQFYVDWLAEKHYLPPGGEKWVDKIRHKGNDATHEIPNMTKDDAELLINFIEMLLRFIYEFPAKA